MHIQYPCSLYAFFIVTGYIFTLVSRTLLIFQLLMVVGCYRAASVT